MCGIFGVFNFSGKNSIDKILFEKATNSLQHRGPDGEGFYYDDENALGFGHRRLAIIDLVRGDQPMCNEDGSIWIVFNGEIYNFLDLKDELIKKGHYFKTNSDTEVIIHAYEEYGYEFPNKLNGIFSFAIWDRNRKLLYLARDHFGVKPLYYYNDGTTFIFASEYKAILSYKDVNRDIDVSSLFTCLKYRIVPPPNTLLKKIKKLGAAHYLILNSKGEIQIKKYYSKKLQICNGKSFNEFKEMLEFQYELAIKRQMIADVPIGLSLSGGVDSATILSLMSKYSNGKVKCYTVGFEGGNLEDNEINKASYLAKLYGAEFNSYTITESDYFNFLEKYIWHLEEPVGNESAIAYYFVAKLAKGNVKVLLNGQGADEPFAGYDRYIGIYHLAKNNFYTRPLLNFIIKLPISNDRKFQINKLIEISKAPDEYEKLKIVYSLINREVFENILNINKISFHDLLDKHLRQTINSNINGSIVEKMFYYDMFSSLSENLLLAEDKMAMAASIEARVPFLDVELVETALSIPARYKIGFTSGKVIHKKVCENYLPKEIVYQRKIGFNNPVSKWLKGKLGEMLLDLINSDNSITKNYLNKNIILKMIKEHEEDQSNYEKFLFLLLSIEQWNKIFIQGEI
ncbi:MAG: asparagine synthase (glutamine-hydrolyzing) [Candidatus Woesearchaeota archaeon]